MLSSRVMIGCAAGATGAAADAATWPATGALGAEAATVLIAERTPTRNTDGALFLHHHGVSVLNARSVHQNGVGGCFLIPSLG